MTTDVQFRPQVQHGRITAVRVFVAATRTGAEGDVDAILTPQEAVDVFRAYSNAQADAVKGGIEHLRNKVAARFGQTVEMREQEEDGGNDREAELLNEEAFWLSDLVDDLDRLLGREPTQ